MICKKDIIYLRENVPVFVQGFSLLRPQINLDQVKTYVSYFYDCLDYEELEQYVLKKESISLIENSVNVKKQMIDNFLKHCTEFTVLELETILANIDFTEFTWFKFSIKNTDAELTQFTKKHAIELISVNKNFLLEIKHHGKKYCGFIGNILNPMVIQNQQSLIHFNQLGHVSYGKILLNKTKNIEAIPYISLFFEKDKVSRSSYEQLFLIFENTVDYQIQTQVNLMKHFYPHKESHLFKETYAQTQIYSIKTSPLEFKENEILFKDLSSIYNKLDFKDNFSMIMHHSRYIPNKSSNKVVALDDTVSMSATYNVSIQANDYNQIILKRYLNTICINAGLFLNQEKTVHFTDRLFLSCYAQKVLGKFDLFQEQLLTKYNAMILDSIHNVGDGYSLTENKYKESICSPFKKQKDNYLIIGEYVFVHDMLNQLAMPLKLVNFKKYYSYLLNKQSYLSITDKNKLLRPTSVEKIDLINKTITKSFLFEYLTYLNFQFKLKLDIEEIQTEFEKITFDNQLIFVEYVSLIDKIQTSVKNSHVEHHLVMFIENYGFDITDSKLYNSLMFMFIIFIILNDDSQMLWVLNNIQDLNLINYVELVDMLFRYRAKIYQKPYLCFAYDNIADSMNHNVLAHIFKTIIGNTQKLTDTNYLTNFSINKLIEPSKQLKMDNDYHYVLYSHDHKYEYVYIQKDKQHKGLFF